MSWNLVRHHGHRPVIRIRLAGSRWRIIGKLAPEVFLGSALVPSAGRRRPKGAGPTAKGVKRVHREVDPGRKREIGFCPFMALTEGVRRFVGWDRAYYNS